MFNLKCVREFYTTLGVTIDVRTNLPRLLTAVVGDKQIKVTPDDIAKYLKYKRPDPATTNYPGDVEIDPARIAEVIYRDPENGLYPIKIKRFKDEILILNKAVHANLFPKGKETRPTKKTLEVMTAFMSPDIVVDWALFILCQMIDYSESAMNTAKMVFPCMVTYLCHKQGVKGAAYTKTEKFRLGTIDLVTLHQSKAQAKHDKGKKPKEGSSTPGPSRAELFKNPPRKAKAITWTKHLVKCVRALFKKTEKVERSQERIEHKANWLIQEKEASSSSRYEALTQPELESTDEEESEDDEGSEEE